MPKISAIIVTYRTRDLLRSCINSLQKELGRFLKKDEYNIIVVDNASNDGTEEMMKVEFPQVIYILNKKNIGPAGAFNQGIREAITSGAPFIIVANSDTMPIEGSLNSMYTFLKENPDIHGVTGKLLNGDMSPQSQRTHIINLARRDYSKRFKIDFIGTTFAMIRAETYKIIGGYDENYYFYNEDLDWAERAKKKRLKFMYLSEAPIIHYLSVGSKQNFSRILRELYKSNVYYFKKFYGILAYPALWFMKFELKKLGAKAKREMNTATTEDQREEWILRLDDYKIALELMNKEFATNREPKIPYFS